MPRDKRQKASQVFSSTNWAFRRPGTFEQAFPNIEDCRIEVTFQGVPLPPPILPGLGHAAIYTRANIGEFVNCRNELCYNGGFDVGSILRQAADERRTEIDTMAFCQRYEGSPKGRRNYGPCGAHFNVKGTIAYKAGTSTRTL